MKFKGADFYVSSAWGEALFMAAQTSIIAALVLKYSYSNMLLPISFFMGYAAVLYSLISDITPIDVLWSMQAANVPIIITSRVRPLLDMFDFFECSSLRSLVLSGRWKFRRHLFYLKARIRVLLGRV